MRSAHFELFTASHESDAVSLLKRLEAGRDYFARCAGGRLPPALLRVVGFGSSGEFALYRSNPFAAGLYASTPGGDYIVLKDISAENIPVALHEYVHHVMHYSAARAPWWWQEGVAEVFSTMSMAGNLVELGAVPPGRDISLRKQWLDFAALLRVDRFSAAMQERSSAEMVYAQNWALAHMVLFSDAYRMRSGEFSARMAAGADTVEVFAQLYEKTPVQILADLKAYIEQRQFKPVHVPITASPATIERSSAASDADLRLALANISLGVGKREQARQILQDLLQEYPDRWEVNECFAYLSWYAGDHGEARGHFETAMSKGMADAQACVHYAGLLGEVRTGSSAIEAVLERALELQPENQQAAMKLASLYLRDRKYQEALNVIGRLPEPDVAEVFRYHLLQGYAHLALGQIEPARTDFENASQHAQSATENLELELLSNSMAARTSPLAPKTPVDGQDPAAPVRIERETVCPVELPANC